MAQEQRFRSGVGWCFGAGLLIVGAVLVVTQSRGVQPASLTILCLVLGCIYWVYTSTAYIVSDQGVLVQSGPVRRWVDAKLVERVRPVQSVLAAPALSENRLEVSGGFGAIVVSPKDQAGFILALKRVAPQVRLEGGLGVPEN